MSTPVEAIDHGRRRVLRSSGLTVAFVCLVRAGPAQALLSPRRQPGDAAAAAADGNPAFAPNAFIRIDSKGPVRLVMPSIEMGQAIYTGSCMLLAEELGIGMDQILVEHSPTSDELYGMKLLKGQITGGSTGTRSTFTELREAGAVARTMLVAAAAARWHVNPHACTVSHGEVHHVGSSRSLSFGALAAAAAKLPEPVKVQLKDPKDFQLLGKPIARIDAGDKVTGATQFGIDVRLPGMKVGTVKACPTLGGTLASVDDSEARKIPGVVDVLKISNAVVVVGEHFWAAKQGLAALKVEWNTGKNAGLTTRDLRAALADSQASGKSIVGLEYGKRPGGETLEATYLLPMLAHATMEPLNATVHMTAGQCEIWVGTQVPARATAGAAKVANLPVEKVTLHNHYIGGGFGRRLETDYVEQAVAFAKQVSYPLKIVWTREEDFQHDIVRPMYHDHISAVVDAKGMPLWFGDRICSGTVLGRWAPGAMRQDGMDKDAIESAADIPYEIENLRVEWVRHDMPPGIVVGWWRGVGAAHNLFVVESFFDELAAHAGKDPVAYRRALLQKNPRTLGVLELAAAKIGWGRQPLPPRVGRGVAVGAPFGSWVCAIVEVEVTPQGEVKLRRVVVAVDCGIAVNTSSIEAQIQGGMVFGLTAALFSEVTFKDGAIQQSNFNDYRVLRINETPPIEVHILKSLEAPGGVGELGTAISAPALTNAIFSATGVRLRELPVRRSLLVQHPDDLKLIVDVGIGTGDVR